MCLIKYLVMTILYFSFELAVRPNGAVYLHEKPMHSRKRLFMAFFPVFLEDDGCA